VAKRTVRGSCDAHSDGEHEERATTRVVRRGRAPGRLCAVLDRRPGSDCASRDAAGARCSEKLIYLDHGLTGRHCNRPGRAQALAAVREEDTLVVTKLDRLARVPDARAIADELEQRGARLQLGATVYDPRDPMGKMFFNVLATFAEFEADLLSLALARGCWSPRPMAG
jgi:Resolvase, N terminal domain